MLRLPFGKAKSNQICCSAIHGTLLALCFPRKYRDNVHTLRCFSKCLRTATAFLIKWYKSSGISGARPDKETENNPWPFTYLVRSYLVLSTYMPTQHILGEHSYAQRKSCTNSAGITHQYLKARSSVQIAKHTPQLAAGPISRPLQPNVQKSVTVCKS